MKKNIFAVVVSIFILLAIIFLLNIKVNSSVGTNYKVQIRKIPVYIKAMSFICRDYEYKEIVKDILNNTMTNEEKVLSLFSWIHENIKPVPLEFPIVDDHILNIIIRGYGTDDQSADVFCNLCSYAGFPAQWAFVSALDSKSRIVLSFVNIGGRWIVFDTYYGNYFRNRKGNLASKEEIINDLSLIDSAMNKKSVAGIEYKDYFKCLQNLQDKDMWRRGDLQFPLKRLIYEFKKNLMKVIKK